MNARLTAAVNITGTVGFPLVILLAAYISYGSLYQLATAVGGYAWYQAAAYPPIIDGTLAVAVAASFRLVRHAPWWIRALLGLQVILAGAATIIGNGVHGVLADLDAAHATALAAALAGHRADVVIGGGEVVSKCYAAGHCYVVMTKAPWPGWAPLAVSAVPGVGIVSAFHSVSFWLRHHPDNQDATGQDLQPAHRSARLPDVRTLRAALPSPSASGSQSVSSRNSRSTRARRGAAIRRLLSWLRGKPVKDAEAGAEISPDREDHAGDEPTPLGAEVMPGALPESPPQPESVSSRNRAQNGRAVSSRNSKAAKVRTLLAAERDVLVADGRGAARARAAVIKRVAQRANATQVYVRQLADQMEQAARAEGGVPDHLNPPQPEGPNGLPASEAQRVEVAAQ